MFSNCSVTAHGISSMFERQKLCLDCAPITKSHTAEHIRVQFESAVSQWPGLRERIYCVMRDGASAVKKVRNLMLLLVSENTVRLLQAFRDGAYVSCWCAAHMLHLCVYDAINVQPSVSAAIGHVRRLAKYMSKSATAKSSLERVMKRNNKQPLVTISVSILSKF